ATRSRWAWKTDVSVGNITAVLLNYDPRNSRYRTDFHPSYTTIDGVNASFPVGLLLRYPIERPLPESQVNINLCLVGPQRTERAECESGDNLAAGDASDNGDMAPDARSEAQSAVLTELQGVTP